MGQKREIHKLKAKLRRTKSEEKIKRYRALLGLEQEPVVEDAPEPVVEAAPEPVVEAAPAVEVVEAVVEEPAPEAKPKPKRTYRRRKTTKAKE